jgi:hypothetical protein
LRWKVVTALALASASASAVACELLLPTYLGAGEVPAEAPSDGCAHVEPPRPPDASANPGSERFFLALRSFGLGNADAGPDVGYDLDETCTGLVDASNAVRSCIPTTKEFVDRSGGRDIEGNERLGTTLNNAFSATGFGTVDNRIADGKNSYLIEVRDYNGEANDDQVYVSVYNSAGLGVPDDGGVKVLHTHAPSWDGEDPWSLDCIHAFACPKVPPDASTEWLGDAGPEAVVSLYADPKAYVRDHVLVAHIPVLVIAVGSAYLRVRGAIITGALEKGPGGYAITKGQLAGRVATRDIFDMLATIRIEIGANVSYLCGDNPGFLDYRAQICTSADINADGYDKQEKPCNALSVAVPFTAGEAKLGFRFDQDDPVRGCPATNDECTTK